MAISDEERKARHRAYERTPEVKAKRKLARNTPEARAKKAVLIKEYKKTEIYQHKIKTKLPDYGAYLDTQTLSESENRAWMLEDSPEDRAKEYIDWHN
jgi:hypothetical protein